MSTEIDDSDTREKLRHLADVIPQHAQQLLDSVRAQADTSVDPEWPAQVDQMRTELPHLVDRLVRRAEQYLEGHASTFDTMLERLDPAWHHIEDLQEILTACQNEIRDWSEEPVSGIAACAILPCTVTSICRQPLCAVTTW